MVVNVTRLCKSHIRIAQDIFFIYWKASDPRYLVLNFSNILPINNWDMA